MAISQTQPIPFPTCDPDKLSHFRFGAFQDGIILTTDQGMWHWLDTESFSHFIAGTLPQDSPEQQPLQRKGFVRSHTNLEDLSQLVRRRKSFLGTGPTLHELYLQDRHGRLPMVTAKAIVDQLMQSTSITLELALIQGAEPLDSSLLDFLISYTEEKNRYENKQLSWTLRSNFHTLSDDIIPALVQHACALHTNLPAVADITPTQEAFFEKLVAARAENSRDNAISATLTITKDQLSSIVSLLDTAASLGITMLYLEPALNGPAAITPQEFQEAYTVAIEHLMSHHPHIKEGHASALVPTLVRPDPSANPSYHSPGGPGLNIHAYDTRGHIYPNAQAALLDDPALLYLGTAGQISYQDTLAQPKLKALTLASILDCLPGFSDHWATPFLNVDPVACYAQTGDLFEKFPSSARVKSTLARLYALLSMLLKEQTGTTALESWLTPSAD